MCSNINFILHTHRWMTDKVYRAVIAANEKEGYKYHLVGGGAGTVSPSE